MRLFVAIDFNYDTKALLAQAAEQLKSQASSGNFVPLENFHLTLVFIGSTARVNDVIGAMRRCAYNSASAFSLAFNGLGSFKSKRGYTWWAGIKECAQLSELAGMLASELTNSGFNIQKRSYKPHVTLGRSVVTKSSIAIPALAELLDMRINVNEISLMKSDLSGEKPRYTKIAKEPLSYRDPS
jgi:2'-5' RNA ligase